MTPHDCIVIGGGPSGATVASLVAQAGFRVLMLERERVPRFRGGESLMPECRSTLQQLGVLDRLSASRFPRKPGMVWVSACGQQTLTFVYPRRERPEESDGWQVVRSEFDEILWRRALESGADCRDCTRVLDVLIDGERATGVRIPGRGDQDLDLPARVVVDATGPHGLLATRLNLRLRDERLCNAAIWTYYRHARRLAGPQAGATMLLQTRDRRSWFWCVPLADDITSVGVVGRSEDLMREKPRPEAIFEEQLVQCPAVAEHLIDAEWVGEFHVARDFSQRVEHAAGPGWLLTGAALGFVDPLFGSGVMLALKSGQMAAEAIIAGLRQDNCTAAQLGSWVPAFVAEREPLRRLAAACCNPEFRLEDFVREQPSRQAAVEELLAGRTMHPAIAPLLAELDAWLAGGNRPVHPTA